MNTPLRVDDSTPGRMLTMADLGVGDSVVQSVTFDPKLVGAFNLLAADAAPVHANPAFARQRGFDAPILQGLCLTSRFSRLLGMYLPGESALVESLEFKFRKPVFADRAVDYEVRIERLLRPLKVVRLRLQASVDGNVCIEGVAQCLIR